MSIRLLMTYYYSGRYRIVMDLDQGLKGCFVGVFFIKYFFFYNKMSILRKVSFLGDTDYSYLGS